MDGRRCFQLFKKEGTYPGVIEEIDSLGEISKNDESNILDLEIPEISSKSVWISADRFKGKIEEQKEKLGDFEDIFFKKCEIMPKFESYIDGLKS